MNKAVVTIVAASLHLTGASPAAALPAREAAASIGTETLVIPARVLCLPRRCLKHDLSHRVCLRWSTARCSVWR
jgi:hypothetical protein